MREERHADGRGHQTWSRSVHKEEQGGEVMARKFMREEYGPSQFAERLRGLVAAAKVIAAEEKIKHDQLELFEKLESENVKFKM